VLRAVTDDGGFCRAAEDMFRAPMRVFERVEGRVSGSTAREANVRYGGSSVAKLCVQTGLLVCNAVKLLSLSEPRASK
jgi:hypothetical protein